MDNYSGHSQCEWPELFRDTRKSAKIALDFWMICGYNSSNLKSVSRRSTVWKRFGTFVILRQLAQVQAVLIWPTGHLFHRIDGPGVVFPKVKSFSSSSL